MPFYSAKFLWTNDERDFLDRVLREKNILGHICNDEDLLIAYHVADIIISWS